MNAVRPMSYPIVLFSQLHQERFSGNLLKLSSDARIHQESENFLEKIELDLTRKREPADVNS